MISKRRFHHTTLPNLVCKYEVVKFSDHPAGINVIVDSTILAPRIISILPAKRIKIGSVFYGEGNAVCELLSSGVLTNLNHLPLLFLLGSNQYVPHFNRVRQLF